MTVRQVETPHLSVEVIDEGPADGPVVLLLHGWPDDATTWDRVAPALNRAGWRTLAPSLRGFGGTRFRSEATPRTGDSGILAQDAADLMDALGVGRFLVAGHDWGSNIAEALAVGWPDRVPRIAMLSTASRLGGAPTPSFRQSQRDWYHWFQATRRGSEAVRADPVSFARVMWDNWSPPGWYDEATFEAVSRAWLNPDFVDVTLYSYRARWDEAEPDPRSADLEERIRATRAFTLPVLYVAGAVDGVNPPEAGRSIASKCEGPVRVLELDGVGHFPTREAPATVAEALVEHFRGS